MADQSLVGWLERESIFQDQASTWLPNLRIKDTDRKGLNLLWSYVFNGPT
jgi:hypothetical protein